MQNDHPVSSDIDLQTRLYRTILTIRRFGEEAMRQYRLGRIYGYYHSPIGAEAVAAGACAALRPDDRILSTHRNHAHGIAKGADPKRMMAELFGREAGYARGRGGSMHMADHDTGNMGTSAIVGGGIPLALGVALGIKREGSDRVAVCFFGDGAANNGVFAESLNLSAVLALPVVFVIENNCYAATTPQHRTALCTDLASRAQGYGLPGVSVFGNDPRAVHDTVLSAVGHARAGGGPTLVEAKTYRYYGHHINDPGAYMPREELERWRASDPLSIARTQLVEAGATEDAIVTIETTVAAAVTAAVAFAEAAPEPDAATFLTEIGGYDA